MAPPEKLNRQQLIALMDKMTGEDGIFETNIQGVNLIRISDVTPKYNIIYQPSIAIIVQGAKRGFIGDEGVCHGIH